MKYFLAFLLVFIFASTFSAAVLAKGVKQTAPAQNPLPPTPGVQINYNSNIQHEANYETEGQNTSSTVTPGQQTQQNNPLVASVAKVKNHWFLWTCFVILIVGLLGFALKKGKVL